MPTPSQTFAVVASTVGGIDPGDREAVARFYQTRFVEYPSKIRELISGFLIGQTHVPSDDALRALKHAVALGCQRERRKAVVAGGGRPVKKPEYSPGATRQGAAKPQHGPAVRGIAGA